MKRIINNKKYDTETATMLGDNWNGYDPNKYPWAYEKEELYIKKNGEYFLVGRGGELSKYGDIYESKGKINEVIIPLKTDEAKKWVAEKLDVDLYETIFGEVDE